MASIILKDGLDLSSNPLVFLNKSFIVP